jgi:hypothetical protein
MNSYGTKYWWSVNVTDGTAWTNNTYNFITSYLPVLINPNPANDSTDVSLWPACNVTVSDVNGGTVTVYFYENTTDSWVLQQTNSSVDVTSSANVVWGNYSNASAASTTYWWSVNVTDGIGWTNNTYHFTTVASPYLYIYKNDKFIKLSDFIPGAISPDKEYTQFIDITGKTDVIDGKVVLKISEELEETTYLNRIYLRLNGDQIVELDTIKPPTSILKPLIEQFFLPEINKQLLRHSDNKYLILDTGDNYLLEFILPTSYNKIEFAAEGYYIEQQNQILTNFVTNDKEVIK